MLFMVILALICTTAKIAYPRTFEKNRLLTLDLVT